MKSLNLSATIVAALLALGAIGACSSPVSQGGSETNWLCSTDANCPSGQVCVDKKCAVKSDGSNVDAGVGGSAGSAGGNSGSSGVGGGAESVTQTTTTFTDVIAEACNGTGCLAGRCLAMKLEPDPRTGKTPCQVLDVRVNACNCAEPGLAPPNQLLVAPALDLLRKNGACDAAGVPACTEMCVCQLIEMSGSALQSCLNDPTLAAGAAGWCYVDPATEPTADPAIVAKCPASEQQLIRFSPLAAGPHSLVVECSTIQAGTAPATPSPGRLGDPCNPGDEVRTTFSGYGVNEVNIESGTPQCETGLCLAANFQGRITCPYGQTDPAQPSCFTPDGAPVTVPVPPQLVLRQADKTVYCSCRCDGPDPSATYCACPSGFDCAPLVADIGLGTAQLPGSFCVKTGTELKDSSNPGAACTAPECGPARP
jgi:hypothetical protein